MKTTVVVGNPKPSSRTLQVAEALLDRLVPGSDRHVIDLAVADDLQPLTERVAASDLVVVASPTYKATYTGLLKSFLDRYGNDGLAGVTAIPVMTGASPAHSLGVDIHLTPLLTELGAVVPGRGWYFVTSDMDQLDAQAAEAAARYARAFARIARLAEEVRVP
ncbi:NAD(P)H-dependent oxidoreductase [Lentzea sp. JNUCC 0626]|uniref:NAD(P)H-dependent oxidoreductase n=1 Tax=Lentzea sp. JNUCC 0626 TaxID=3367513 RepID=UPI0037480926